MYIYNLHIYRGQIVIFGLVSMCNYGLSFCSFGVSFEANSFMLVTVAVASWMVAYFPASNSQKVMTYGRPVTYCNTLQHIATHCDTLQHNCNHAASRCNSDSHDVLTILSLDERASLLTTRVLSRVMSVFSAVFSCSCGRVFVFYPTQRIPPYTCALRVCI